MCNGVLKFTRLYVEALLADPDLADQDGGMQGLLRMKWQRWRGVYWRGPVELDVHLEAQRARLPLNCSDQIDAMSDPEKRANPPAVKCQQCGSDMEETVLANEHTGVTAAAVILAILGVILLFVFPIGTIIGVILLIAAPTIANRSKDVWRCTSCGYFFERA